MPFNENLKLLRTKNKLTQAELGKILNLSRSTISNYEAGKMQPSIETIIEISKYFKITIDSLLKIQTIRS